MSQPASEFHTPIPFTVLTDYPIMDGAGTVFYAYQAERDDRAHTKYCRVVKRAGERMEDVCEVPGIYAEPKLFIRTTDGGCTVSGLSRDKKTQIRADVPDFVPVPSVAALMARIAALEEKK
jgi:hypothetical protein